MSLPRLSLSQFAQGGDDERRKFAAELLDSLTRHGFVKIVDHAVPDATVLRLFDHSRAFFNESLENKAAVANQPGPNPQRGWSKAGAENTATLYRKGLLKSKVEDGLRDAREHFDFGARTDLKHPNKWPEEMRLPGFCEEMQSAFDELENCTSLLMEALEMAFGLPRGIFLDKMTRDRNASEMRLNHYPAISIEELSAGRVSRIWPHFDLGVVTLLFQDNVGGLEYEDRRRRSVFNRIDCAQQTDLVVNVSETLQRWTNDRLPSGLHRVNVPPSQERESTGMLPERYSIAYFAKADRDACVGALKQFVPENTEPSYPDMNAIEYHRQRLQSAY